MSTIDDAIKEARQLGKLAYVARGPGTKEALINLANAAEQEIARLKDQLATAREMAIKVRGLLNAPQGYFVGTAIAELREFLGEPMRSDVMDAAIPSSDRELVDMLKLREEIDPEAPDAIVLPSRANHERLLEEARAIIEDVPCNCSTPFAIRHQPTCIITAKEAWLAKFTK